MGIISRSAPDGSTAQPLSYLEGRHGALTASAVRIDLKQKGELDALKRRHTAASWQSSAWDYYDLVPEIKFAANLLANVTSRVRLYPGFVTSQDAVPANIKDADSSIVSDDLKRAAHETVRLLESGNGGSAGVLRDAVLNLFIGGECYLVREPEPGSIGPGRVWKIRSVDEIVVQSGRKRGVAIKQRSDARQNELVLLPPDTYFGRIWRMHPRFSDEADSSMRGLLDLCEQLLLYSRATRGLTRSRLNAGILFIPDEFSNLTQADGELEADQDGLSPQLAPLADDDSDAFEEELIDAMTKPIENEGSASSVVPMLVRGPAELGEKIKHITLARNFDPQISKDAERTLDRILAGLDLPKDVIKGLGGVKYANAVTIDETLYKAHIEPLVLMLVDSLTVVLMHPVLKSLGFSDEEVSRVVFWYDPSAITTKPDKATAATTGYEMQTISAEAWRRANGFSESDAPTELEIAQRLAVSKGLISEPIMEALLYTLIPDLLDKVKKDQLSLSDPDAVQAINSVLDGGAPAQEKQEGSAEEAKQAPASPEAPALLEP